MNPSKLDPSESSVYPTSSSPTNLSQYLQYVSTHPPTRLSPCPQRPSSTSPLRLSPSLLHQSSSPSSNSPTRLSPSPVLVISSSPTQTFPFLQTASSSSSSMGVSPCPSPMFSSSPIIRLSPCPPPLQASSPLRLSPCPQLPTSHSPTRLSPCSTPLTSPVILKRPIRISSFGERGSSPLESSDHGFPCRKTSSECSSLMDSSLILTEPSSIKVFVQSDTAKSDCFSMGPFCNYKPSHSTVMQGEKWPNDSENSKPSTIPLSKRQFKSIPISNTRVPQTSRHQYQDANLASSTSTGDKKESVSPPKLRHIGRGSQDLVFFRRRHLTQDPVLMQARLGLNKTGSSRVFDDKAKSNTIQDVSKIGKAMDSQTKHQIPSAEEKSLTLLLNNRHQKISTTQRLPESSISKHPSSQLRPELHFKLQEDFIVPSCKKQDNRPSPKQSRTLTQSFSTKSQGSPEICDHKNIGRVSQQVIKKMNSSSLWLKTSGTKSHEPVHPNKSRFTASETPQAPIRFPLRSHGPAGETSRLVKTCRPESDSTVTTTSNYAYTPKQLSHTLHFPLSSRTCRRGIQEPGSLSDSESTYSTSNQAWKKASMSDQARCIVSQQRSVCKSSQKSVTGSDTDSSKSTSSRTSSQEDDTQLRRHKGLRVPKKRGLVSSTQSAVRQIDRGQNIQLDCSDLPRSPSFSRNPCTQSDPHAHTDIPEPSVDEWRPQQQFDPLSRADSGTDKLTEQPFEGEKSRGLKVVEEMNFTQIHQREDLLQWRPYSSEELDSELGKEKMPHRGVHVSTGK
ncbi:hypothetical protein AMEX_G24275 [Astyanax mexicanus]|uniref:Uncharacterized protein n=1 Tax=Astyanax mexicanus TaxID=7994 RepID=A0A8T2KSB8_ASTMX|nr:hypothetical protein AMEX_G24275 [Astyanax mexicanus]